jgi:hypothetical protein
VEEVVKSGPCVDLGCGRFSWLILTGETQALAIVLTRHKAIFSIQRGMLDGKV